MLTSQAMKTQARGYSSHPAFYVVSWIVTSNLTIIFNKWVIDVAGFAIILTTLHLVVSAALTQLLARYTSLIPRPKHGVTARVYIRCILPIGVLYTLSLLCSNLAYVTLSVSFISMLKALAPVTTLLISWVANFTDPSTSKLLNVLVIAFGVLLSSIGEVTFAWTGFLFQIIGTVAESSRLLLIQWLLVNPGAAQPAPGAGDEEQTAGAGPGPALGLRDRDRDRDCDDGTPGGSAAYTDREDGPEGLGLPTHDGSAAAAHDAYPQQLKKEAQDEADAGAVAAMSPLVLLYYYAPVCAVLNCLTALVTEVPHFKAEDLSRVGIGMLALNGSVAFLLNVSSVFLIGKTSALTMNLTGILKSLLLVAASVVLWSTPITSTQAVGYGIALAGMFYYALPPDSPPPHRLLLTQAGRLFGWGLQGPGRHGRTPSGIQLGSVRGGRAGDYEDSLFLLDEDGEDKDGGAAAPKGRARRRSELNVHSEKLASHED